MTYFDDYKEKFNDTFPSMQLGLDEDICKECLEKNKDVYELGYLDKDIDKKY
jgi:hypothetical protein